eukprot:14529-Pyramimonas_sp.AAC.1
MAAASGQASRVFPLGIGVRCQRNQDLMFTLLRERGGGMRHPSIRQVSGKQVYYIRNVKGRGRLACDRRRATAEGWRAPFLSCKQTKACLSKQTAA